MKSNPNGTFVMWLKQKQTKTLHDIWPCTVYIWQIVLREFVSVLLASGVEDVTNCIAGYWRKHHPKIEWFLHKKQKCLYVYPSSFSLFIQIVSRGDIVLSSTYEAPNKVTELSFEVTSTMAPSPRLIVFYVAADHEVILASINFKVAGMFENEVSLT